jgi:serine O-acetyltransferase
MGVMKLYRLGRWCYVHRVPVLPQLVYRLIFFLYGAVVPIEVDLGEGTILAYGGSGVVLHASVRVGRNVTISPQVVLGGRCGHGGVPLVEDDVHIGVGAKVLGPIRIGAGSRIGANAVVIEDVPPRCAVAGVPARVVRTEVTPCTCAVLTKPDFPPAPAAVPASVPVSLTRADR